MEITESPGIIGNVLPICIIMLNNYIMVVIVLISVIGWSNCQRNNNARNISENKHCFYFLKYFFFYQ